MSRTSVLAVLAVTLLLADPASAQITALTHATVIDGSGAPARQDHTILMEHGRIRDVGPSASVTVPPGATVVDLGGRKFE